MYICVLCVLEKLRLVVYYICTQELKPGGACRLACERFGRTGSGTCRMEEGSLKNMRKVMLFADAADKLFVDEVRYFFVEAAIFLGLNFVTSASLKHRAFMK